MSNKFIIFAGSANPLLAQAVAEHLGAHLGACTVQRFPDGEALVRLDASVRGQVVFIIQPTAPPVDQHLMELLIFADACRRAAAAHIVAIVPYFGYARQDRRRGHREPITARMVAELLETVGVGHVIAVDVHTAQLEGFFHAPMDDLTAMPLLFNALREQLPPNVVVVSPDVGRVAMATEYAQRLGTSVVILHKRRESGTQTEVTHIVGDVRGRSCLIVDDMIATGGTIVRGAQALLAAGARPDITVAATHGLFIGDARAQLSTESIRALFVTDTMPVAAADWPRLHVVSVAPLLAAAVRQIMCNGSLRGLRE
jgi:ribose-phosphate pyrophosphokinase